MMEEGERRKIEELVVGKRWKKKGFCVLHSPDGRQDGEDHQPA